MNKDIYLSNSLGLDYYLNIYLCSLYKEYTFNLDL